MSSLFVTYNLYSFSLLSLLSSLFSPLPSSLFVFLFSFSSLFSLLFCLCQSLSPCPWHRVSITVSIHFVTIILLLSMCHDCCYVTVIRKKKEKRHRKNKETLLKVENLDEKGEIETKKRRKKVMSKRKQGKKG